MERAGNNSEEPPLGGANLAGTLAVGGTVEFEHYKAVVEVRESAMDRVRRLKAEADAELWDMFGGRWIPQDQRGSGEDHIVGLYA